ncbi:MAG: FKBP-type peptidyl-prolyl cis-trans isomerase [Nitrospirota bacterium]|jgi:FKBP-type peptidyl-prolyl cis-trans isomerase (trigger factor)
MKRLGGLTLLDEREGAGRVAQKGAHVVYNMRLYLNKGDEVLLNEKQAEHVPKEKIRIQDGVTLIDRTVTLGRREVIAGVEQALIGMKAGGYRKVRISPHLAYRDKGLPGLIPPHAVLVVEIWLRAVLEASTVRAQ